MQNSKKHTHDIYFYYRTVGGNNGYVTYSDYVVIDNYNDNLYTIKQLSEIARSYIDTVKADKPVSGVTFVGKHPYRALPKAGWDNFHNQKRSFIMGFGFENELRQFANKENPNIGVICIWQKGEPQIITSEKEINSLLNMESPFSNNFN